MSSTLTNPHHGLNLAGFFRNFAANRAEARARRAKYAEVLSYLDSLTNAELADLGVSRLSITDIARKTAYGN